ncbi:glycolate oxidase subunit GlcE [Phyllobacterium bourgognense]|uniref:Glycolate oxidase FAD binding subunit n=1 Tax=Phyllobacterium bourgognense TaxID=314236 RepID=A0A368Z7H5_9HYPH|nr:glycolate oxidase subunit GlcE [Phyllobacterium bourgognense]RCW87738.1 glycolate oxidase FAD binding subunit [Phyllobacterium bourgognense]
MTIFTPKTEDEIVEALQWALSENAPVEVVGQGSKRNLGRPLQTEHTIALSEYSGVTLYEPDELVLSAKAGTPVAELETLLAENGQAFQFEPMDYGPLLGQASGQGTFGGLLATNLCGPRRLKSGSARDHVLGVRVVSGRGELFKSGGRVVKNVTGYDLSKGMANSWGTLGIATEITFKVLPAPETETTLVVRGLADDEAARAMAIAMGSSGEVASAAHLPVNVSGRVIDGDLNGDASTLLRLEGFAPSVNDRAAMLKGLLASAGTIADVSGDTSRKLWQEIRDVIPFADGTEQPVWRVSMVPMEAYKLVASLRMGAAVDAYYDWQGGLVWLRMEGEPEAEAVRALIKKYGGGHATLVRASTSLRAALPVFEPQPAPLAALSKRLKQQFDPSGILNPGRMVAGV